MKKRDVNTVFLLAIIVLAVLVAPVAAVEGLTITDSAKITSTDGITSPVITIAGDTFPAGSTITIDVSSLNGYVAGYLLTDANVEVSTDSLTATWSGVVNADGTTLTLTSDVGDTIDGESVIVTFTGAAGGDAAWVADSMGEQSLPLTVTRNDNSYDPSTITFMIHTGGLSIKEGDLITSPTGATSTEITVTGSEIPEGSTIIIDLYYAKGIFASGTFTDANIAISSSSAATWTPSPIDNDYLTLTATGGTAVPGDIITVTFTGTAGNPWGTYTVTTGEPMTYDLYAIRDGYTPESFGISINMVSPVSTGLSIENGAPITSTTGATSPVITITDQLIARDGTITIFLPFLPSLIASGSFNNDNVMVSNTGDAIWTREVTGDRVILTSTVADTAAGDTVTVTFTGESNPWVTSLPLGGGYSYITAVRGDDQGTGYFNITISTPDPTDLSIAKGATITSTTGATSPVITITGADILKDGTITMEVTGLNEYVANGTLTNDNIRIDDNADRALWTASVASDASGFNYLTLTSTGGPTVAGETVNVTFTGETNPWKGNINDEKTVTLYPTRDDGAGTGSFNFVINTSSTVDITLDLNFIGTPRSGIVPLTVAFTDLSTVSPIVWSWDFGDGTDLVTEQNPTHIYEEAGSYNVSLYIENLTSNGVVSKLDYITVLNGAIKDADTSIAGLTIDNCGGPQTITVNTSILTDTVLTQGALEIHPPSGSGFKNIIFYGSFSQNGDLITGAPASVHLVSEDIAPSLGFSSNIGTGASFYYTIDLTSYPCNAILSTKIIEGVSPYYDSQIQQLASVINDTSVGTAYTATITKTNFPAGTPVKIYMSVNSNWNPSISGDWVVIWRNPDDGSDSQILQTRYLYTANNLDYYEADSPLGMSTFGLSSIAGTNNPFQMVAYVAANVVNPGSNPKSGSGNLESTNGEQSSPNTDTMQRGPVQEPAPGVPNKPAPLTQPAMSTNVGMVGWILSMIQNNPLVLVIAVGVIAVVAYFGWWKRRL